MNIERMMQLAHSAALTNYDQCRQRSEEQPDNKIRLLQKSDALMELQELEAIIEAWKEERNEIK